MLVKPFARYTVCLSCEEGFFMWRLKVEVRKENNSRIEIVRPSYRGHRLRKNLIGLEMKVQMNREKRSIEQAICPNS